MSVQILYLIDSLTHGGTELQLAELICNLDSRRFTPHLCTLKPSVGLYDELNVQKICLHYTSFTSLSLIRIINTLSQYLRDNRIQIVHTFFQDPFLLAALARTFNRFLLIGSFRDLGFWRTPGESRKMRMSYPFFDGFIANSQAVKASFMASDGIPAKKIHVIYNGFDLSKVPTETVLPSAPVIGIVANLNRQVKRVQDFIKAAAIIHSKRPDARFIVVGGGHLQHELQALADASGIADYTAFTGMIPNPLFHVRGFMIGVITSETEGFCNAIIEYMASGVPVVATRTGGNVEMIHEGENGFLYDVGNIDELVERLLLLLDDREVCATIGRANSEKVHTHYSLEKMITAHQNLYTTLLTS